MTVALISGLSAWNNFLIAITFLQSPSVQPVSAALYAFQQGFSSNYTLIAAAGILMLLPMMLLFLALQRHFVAGISAGGLGGSLMREPTVVGLIKETHPISQAVFFATS